MESAVADEVESVRVPPAFGAGEVGHSCWNEREGPCLRKRNCTFMRH
jgi:hypothetical protein